MTVSQALQLAAQHHKSGRLAEAETLYRQILAAEPKHADALHLLGVIAHQVGRHDVAVEWICQAIVLEPGNPAAHYNLGDALRATGRLEEAIASYSRALELRPNHRQTEVNLGAALAAQGRIDEAIAAYRRALESEPDVAEVHNFLGDALRRRGQFGEAVASCRRALELKPDFPEAELHLGAALAGQGRLDEAIAAYGRALDMKPDLAEAHNNLGNALAEKAQLDEAIAAYRRAIGFKPDYSKAHNNLGNALKERGQLDEAIEEYRRAIALRPDYPEIHSNLGNALWERGQLDEAIAACRHAITLKPDYPEAHNNLGNALKERGQLDEAVAAYRCAITLKSDYPEAHNNLGNALKDQGELDEAIAAYHRALEVKPDYVRAHSNLIHTLQYHPGYDHRTISEEQQRWNRQFGDPQKQFVRPHANPAVAGRRLRVGYVSPDFRDHPVGRQALPLIERHDREQYEILCYSGVVRPDWITERIRAATMPARNASAPASLRAGRNDAGGGWRNTVGTPDGRLAEMIREDRVDILVDLAQHTAWNRLPVFARQPAPIQVSFAGYPESTGLEAIEYRISDRHLEGESADERTGRKERVCLIDSFWCYDPCGVEAEVNGLPARESGRITFGCLNNFCKVNEQTLSLWSQVLGTVKDSRLVLLSGIGAHRQRTLEAFERKGVEARRVEFVEARPRRDYLKLYHRVDIVLDTAPYNGHTTSLDALWMGVPVVSLAGKTPVSRAGLSQLTNLGLSELVAHLGEDYVTIAVELARDFPRLALLRSTLRDRMGKSVLMDAPRFTRQVEQAYRAIWEAWRPGQSPIRDDI